MPFFRKLSIRDKLVGIMLFITLLSTGTGLVFVTVNDIRTFRSEMAENMNLIARVIGDYSIVDLMFHDREESEKTLAKLSAIENIRFAYVYDSSGNLFGAYGREGRPTTAPPVQEPSSSFQGDSLHVIQSIEENNQKFGTIYLIADTAPLYAKIKNYLYTMLALAGALAILAVMLALRFQGIFSRPILNLAQVAQQISKKADYSIRVKKTGEDEIGILYDGFNAMLSQIEIRRREREKAEEALKQSEQRFRHIVQQSNDAMYVLVGRKMLFVNPKFTEYLGYTSEETRSEDFDVLNLVAPESRNLLMERAEMRERGEPVPSRYIFRAISRSGVLYDFETNVNTIEWDGQPAILGTLRDVTERLRAEEQLRKQQEQLRRYADELERSNRELDQFAYITSHDLKAPLQAISNLSEWIEEDLSPHITGESRKHMDLLRRRVQRMVGLIDGILEFSRVRRMRQEPEQVDSGKLLAEIIDMIDRPPGFVIDVPPDMPELETERIRLHQVFANLIGNAVKHHEGPDGKVEVRWEDLGNWFEFSVADNGPGIAREYHEKVFIIFQTLKPRDKFESTGVGLALVKRIVEDKGGKITLESEEGKGAVFRFTWPKKMKEWAQ